jgi:hypothetical protein
VIRSTGELGGYAWGIERKKVMLMREAMNDRRSTIDDPSTQPLRKQDSPPGVLRVSASGARRARSA